MEPQVGNKIRIKHNLLIGRYGTNSVVEEMQRYKDLAAEYRYKLYKINRFNITTKL